MRQIHFLENSKIGCTLEKICDVHSVVNRDILMFLLSDRCRIVFGPHWISARGVLIQQAVLKIRQIFYVD